MTYLVDDIKRHSVRLKLENAIASVFQILRAKQQQNQENSEEPSNYMEKSFLKCSRM